jgi:hypothetical protein
VTAQPLQGVTRQQQRELQAILKRLSGLWAELTDAAAQHDAARVAAVQREIATCRSQVERIKHSGTAGSA